MIQVTPFANQTVAVFGLGRTGVSAARALGAGGATVWAWDDDADTRAAAERAGIALTDLYGCDWTAPECLVLSPGIPDSFPAPHPLAERARANGKEIICDIDLLARTVADARYVGITGTNGKSTTTALIGHILGAAGREVQVGGNFGVPALDLEPLGESGTYILELSSYQLERMPTVTYDVAVLINISPDHLDRHGGMDGYVAAKKRIFDHPREAASAVIGMDDRYCREMCFELMLRGDHKIIPISGTNRAPGGVYAEDGVLIDDMDNGQARVLDLKTVGTLPGAHNWQNAAAAYAAARAAGLDSTDVVAGIASYPGLAHRQEMIAAVGGVTYVNDSKATNVEAALRALACYRHIHWIAGGQPKEGGFKAILEAAPRIRHAYLIGEAAAEIADDLGSEIPHSQCGDLETAFAAAREAAKDGDTVLLSPACASFDQFDNFEARGAAFRKLVEAMA